MAATAIVALAAGVAVGARHTDPAQALAERYVAAWARGDHAAMHRMLTSDARRRTPLGRFRSEHRKALATATAVGMRAGRVDGVRATMSVRTRIFGIVAGRTRLPVVEDGDRVAVEWVPRLAFPGLRRGERLRRRAVLPPRAALLARDGTVLVAGADRVSPSGLPAPPYVGTLGDPGPAEAARAYAAGVPRGTPMGVGGLERWLEPRLRGRPGGELRAGRRVLARSSPRRAPDVRTSIDPDVQQATELALAGRLGGVVALRPATGEVLGLTGLATTGAQPPGSTFKVVTLVGALEAGIVSPRDRFPVQTEAILEGVALENANDEACGGTLRQAFAHSCNSVFAPLGAELGARRLVEAAERFGFNGPPPLPGASTSTIPRAEDIGDDLAVGSTAIGQGRVLATTLQMAWIAATIANDGRRVAPVVRAGARGRAEPVLGADVARVVTRAMRAVVRDGTGQAAQIEGVPVAGKTGTAELRTTQVDESAADPTVPAPVEDTTDTDAWFIAFAPAPAPEIAVAVLLVGQGAGGTTAAPAATGVIAAGLKAAEG